MAENSDDVSEPFGASVVQEILDRHLGEARRTYEQLVNRLWAGNAAGIAAVLSISEKGNVPKFIAIVALIAFCVGLFSLSIAAFSSIVRQPKIIKDLESARTILDLKIEFIRRPSEDAKLSWRSFSTSMSLIATLMFIIGSGFFAFVLIAIIK